MKRLTQEELNKKILDHRIWMQDAGGKRAEFSDCDLSGLDMSGADLRRADLQEADLQGAYLREADLREANLQSADLKRTDLQGAGLQWVNLHGADLQEADLRYTDLWGANLRYADLWGADLEGANLEGAALQEATGYIQKIEGVEDRWDVAIFPHGWIAIGCKTHHLDYWIEHYQEIGEDQRLTQEEIDQYGEILKSLKEVD